MKDQHNQAGSGRNGSVPAGHGTTTTAHGTTTTGQNTPDNAGKPESVVAAALVEFLARDRGRRPDR